MIRPGISSAGSLPDPWIGFAGTNSGKQALPKFKERGKADAQEAVMPAQPDRQEDEGRSSSDMDAISATAIPNASTYLISLIHGCSKVFNGHKRVPAKNPTTTIRSRPWVPRTNQYATHTMYPYNAMLAAASCHSCGRTFACKSHPCGLLRLVTTPRIFCTNNSIVTTTAIAALRRVVTNLAGGDVMRGNSTSSDNIYFAAGFSAWSRTIQV